MEIKEYENKKLFNEDYYHYENLKIARDFSKALIKEVPNLIKSIVIFGSTAIEKNTPESDVDILIIVDNISYIITEEVKNAYYTIVEDLVNKISTRLHITTINLTDFWDQNRNGDPIIINILRTGYALYDENLFIVAQALLKMGKIRPTFEAALNYRNRSLMLFENNRQYLEEALKDLYYAVTDISHSILILEKELPPSPRNIGEIFEKHFKKSKKKDFHRISEDIKEFYKLYKDIEHKKIKNINIETYTKYYKKAENIINTLNKYFNKKVKNIDIFNI